MTVLASQVPNYPKKQKQKIIHVFQVSHAEADIIVDVGECFFLALYPSNHENNISITPIVTNVF